MKKTIKKDFSIFLFYIINFSILIFCIVLNISLFKNSSILFKSIFFFHSLLQSFLAILLLFILAKLLKRFLHTSVLYIYTGICFVIVLLHFINFIMLHLLDSSIAYPFKMFFLSGKENFFITIRAINANPVMLLVASLTLLLLPAIGILKYHLIHKFTHKRNLHFTSRDLLFSFLTIAFCLFTLELGVSKLDEFKQNKSKYIKKLPLRCLCFVPNLRKHIIKFEKPIKATIDEEKVFEKIEKLDLKLVNEKSPNIYLFVMESFRNDYVTEEIAPNLHSFKNENISFGKSYSNANATHISWFSIFYSKKPFFWTDCAKKAKLGSPNLTILKKLGYKINVISSAELTYFHLDKLLFGKKYNALDSMIDFSQNFNLSTSQRDRLVFKTLSREIETKKEKNLFIIFLDSTHSEYSWPDDFKTKFTPVIKNINYLSYILPKKDITPLINRYKNSINFLDSEYEKFFKNLKANKIYDDSIILITGDHAEEFYEDGSLFHASHLNHFQTFVPLYYKLGNSLNKPTCKYSSHIDIFPTIFHHLTNTFLPKTIVDGSSIFDPNKNESVLSVNQNCADIPKDFIIRHKLSDIHGSFIHNDNSIDSILIENSFPNKNLTKKDIQKIIKSCLIN
jgi:hypothetical protein